MFSGTGWASRLYGIFTLLYFCRKFLLTFVYVYHYSNCEMASGDDPLLESKRQCDKLSNMMK
jgi:hypothetical protein